MSEEMNENILVESFINKRLAAIFKNTDSWGPPLAVELQVILLIEMWHVNCGRTEYFVYNTNSRFIKFIYRDDRAPGPNNLPLAHQLKLDNSSNEIFVEILKDFTIKEREK